MDRLTYLYDTCPWPTRGDVIKAIQVIYPSKDYGIVTTWSLCDFVEREIQVREALIEVANVMSPPIKEFIKLLDGMLDAHSKYVNEHYAPTKAELRDTFERLRLRVIAARNGSSKPPYTDYDPVSTEHGLKTQKGEFDAFVVLTQAYNNMPPIVDDDYPRRRQHYENALRDFMRALIANRPEYTPQGAIP